MNDVRDNLTLRLNNCIVLLELLRDHWLRAKTAQISHEASQNRSQRISRILDGLTLFFALLTMASVLIEKLLTTGSPVVSWISIAGGSATGISKISERVLSDRRDRIKVHGAALVEYENHLQSATFLSLRIEEHLEKMLQHGTVAGDDALEAKIRELGNGIERTRQEHLILPVAGADDKATKAFNSTHIHELLSILRERRQKQDHETQLDLAADSTVGRAFRQAR